MITTEGKITNLADYVKMRQYHEAQDHLGSITLKHKRERRKKIKIFNAAVDAEDQICRKQWNVVKPLVWEVPVFTPGKDAGLKDGNVLNPNNPIKNPVLNPKGILNNHKHVLPDPVNYEDLMNDPDKKITREPSLEDIIQIKGPKKNGKPKKKKDAYYGWDPVEQSQAKDLQGADDWEWDPSKQAAFDKMRKKTEKKQKDLANPGKSCFCNMC